MPSVLDRIYDHSPVLVQNLMATGYGLQQRFLRYSGKYNRFTPQLDRQQWLSREELIERQAAALRRTISFAAENVPYYRELFAREKIRPEHIRSVEDLRILPVLDKRTVQEQGDKLRPDRVTVKALSQTTGGTTGRPVPYWVSPKAVQFNYATYEVRFRRWAGVALGDRMVSINGKPIVPMRQRGGPFWRHNLAFNQLYVSAYHLSDHNMPAIVERIAAFRPEVIVAYVSSVHRIARYMNDHGLAGHIRPRAILVSSETLFDWQREDLSRAFACKVFNGYSLGEPVCFISECEEGTMHISPEFGVVEYVDFGEGLEIVATGLVNDAMPMLRYRTGDIADPGDGKPCACGRGLPTAGPILGRIDETVVTPDGAAVGPAALSLAFQFVPNLRESQIVQHTPARITLKVCVTTVWSKDNETFLLGELRKRLGHRLEVDLEYVDAVPRTVSGKQRLIVSHLARRA